MSYAIGELKFISGLPVSMPLIEGWVEGAAITHMEGLPGELDAAMAAGTIAAGPISSLEYARRKDRYKLIGELSISSWGRVGSAMLFSAVPFSQLEDQTVAVPRWGATSNVMLKWLLGKMFGVEPRFEEVDGNLAALLQAHPAALVIGDEALIESGRLGDKLSIDLGEAWWMLMKAPMVHTVWACQASLPEADQDAIESLFAQAKEQGKARRAEVVAEAARRTGLSPESIEGYYALLNYDLSPVHMQSLKLFDELVQEVAPV